MVSVFILVVPLTCIIHIIFGKSQTNLEAMDPEMELGITVEIIPVTVEILAT
jgi:hypothetical protein